MVPGECELGTVSNRTHSTQRIVNVSECTQDACVKCNATQATQVPKNGQRKHLETCSNILRYAMRALGMAENCALTQATQHMEDITACFQVLALAVFSVLALLTLSLVGNRA